MAQKHARRLFLFACLAYTCLYLPGLDRIPQIAMDEGWNVLYSLQEFGSLPYPELKTNIQYKLFFFYYLLSAPILKLLGISLWSIRFVAFLSGLAGVLALYKISTLLKWSRLASILVYSGFIFSNISFVIFRWGRPEGMLTTATLFLIYFVLKGQLQNNNSSWAMAGALSVFLLMTHPFSAIAGLPLAVLLLFKAIKKDFKPLLFAIAGAIPFIALFLINALIINWDYSSQFLNNHLSARLSVNSKHSLFERSITFLNHYTLGIKRLYIFLFEIGILLFGCFSKKSTTASKITSFFGLSMFISGLLLFSPFRRRYFCLVAITSLITLGELLRNSHWQSLKKQTIIPTALIGLFFSNSLAGDLYYLYINKDNRSYGSLQKELQQLTIPKDSPLLVPIHLWIPFHQHYSVTDVHHLPDIGYNSLEELLNNQKEAYILSAPYLLKNNSPTTGQTSTFYTIPKGSFLFQTKELTENKAKHLHTIQSPPYGELSLYKLQN